MPSSVSPGQVQPVELGIMTFQTGDDAQGLRVVIKATIRRHERMERIFASVAKRRVSQVMRQRHCLCQVGVQVQRIGDGSCHLRHLDRMGQPGAIEIALVLDENLRLVFQPAEGRAVNDPVAVALETGPVSAFFFREVASPRTVMCRGKAGAHVKQSQVACPAALLSGCSCNNNDLRHSARSGPGAAAKFGAQSPVYTRCREPILSPRPASQQRIRGP